MFRTLFGELHEGRIARLPYLGYSLLTTVLAGLGWLGLALLLGDITALVSENSAALEVFMHDVAGKPLILLMVGFGLAISFAHANLTAKRYRDMGLGGWSTLISISLALALGAWVIGPILAGCAQGLVYLGLALLPSGCFGRPPAAAP